MIGLPELLQAGLDVVQPSAAHFSLYRMGAPLVALEELPPPEGGPISAPGSEVEVDVDVLVATPPPEVTAGSVGGSPDGPRRTWRHYCSIENCSNAKALERFQELACAADCEWVACEKVHGANFSFVTDGASVEYAKRSSLLGNGADFMNCTTTMPKYHPFVLRAFELAKRTKQDLESLTIYGEYFGGYFPDRKKVNGLKTVQKGVAYSPEHHFYAFDVSLDNQGYMNFDEARELLLAAGFPLVATPLRRGSFAAVYSLDVESLHTTLPPLLGLPMPSQCYIAEGVVIRPVREINAPPFGRAVLKKKAQAFWEATGQSQMKKARAYREAPALKPEGVPSSEAEYLQLLRAEAARFITANRLRAVVSKDPSLVREGKEKRLIGLLTQDALQDMAKESADADAAEGAPALGGKEGQALRRHLHTMAQVFVAEHLPELRADLA